MTPLYNIPTARNPWLDRAKPLDYEWAPNEVDTDLWYDIIDALGMPSWIRAHRRRASQPWVSFDGEKLEDSIYVKPYGTITTETMCDVTHLNWLPIARVYDGSEWSSPRDIFLGYYSKDLDRLEAGTSVENAHDLEELGTFEELGINVTRIIHLPPVLYL